MVVDLTAGARGVNNNIKAEQPWEVQQVVYKGKTDHLTASCHPASCGYRLQNKKNITTYSSLHLYYLDQTWYKYVNILLFSFH